MVAAITPWNPPLLLAAWKLAPALAAGNTVMWEPSEFSPVSALEFGRLFEAAGLPPGVQRQRARPLRARLTGGAVRSAVRLRGGALGAAWLVVPPG